MRLGVGSTNPVKRNATEAAIGDMPGLAVESVDVKSGVSEQPFGIEETTTGATNRARRAYEADRFDLGVGIEGGVARFDGVDGLFLVMWAAVTDGDTVELGGGPSIRLPERIAGRVDDGEELGPVMDDEFDMENVAKNQGAVGVLTGGAIDRTEALKSAVTGALGPFVTDVY